MTISATTQGIKPGVCTSSTRPVTPFIGMIIYETDTLLAKVWTGSAWVDYPAGKADTASPTFTGTVVLPATTSIGTVSNTEIGYVDGVTSAIQTQLDSKLTATTAVTSNRNVIINGSFGVWQRSTDATTVGSYGYATADRWISRTASGGGSVKVSRQATSDTTNLPNIQYCARVQRTASNTDTGGLQIIHTLETANSIPFAGKTVTLSFYARKGANYSHSGGGMSPQLYSGTGTDQHWTSFTSQSTVIAETSTLSATWQRFSYSASVASTATQLYIIFQMVPVGTAGANDYFEVTGVQLEVGAVATPFEFEDYSITLAKCLRYYQKSYLDTTAPGSAAQTPGLLFSPSFTAVTNSYSFAQITFQIPMRSAPTVTVYSYTSGTAGVVSNVQGTDLAANSGVAFFISSKSANIQNNAGSSITPNLGGFLFHFVASAEL